MVDFPALFLRSASRADAPGLARLRCASLIELGHPGAHEPSFERDAARAFDALLSSGELAAWLLVADGRVAGSACALFWHRLPYPGTSLQAELAGVYVAPAFRRRGIARELCREAIAASHARGTRRIVVHPSSAGAALYAELGFTAGNELRL
ncbi:MAG: GNAT family N-acetyltransferase [Vulcanimicrobiaceae bacterium]